MSAPDDGATGARIARRAGDPVAWRVRVRITPDRLDGELGSIWPVTVVRDEPDEVALYLAPGSVSKVRRARHGGPHGRVILEMLDEYSDNVWLGHRLLLRRPSEAHSVSLFWHEPTHAFRHWYVDLVSPLRRTRSGFDSVDHGIDIIVEPDMSAWRWKDAEELDWYVEHGRYTVAEAQAIRAEGERAVANLQSQRERFERWVSWRPDPRWPVPVLPSGWDTD